MPQSVNTVSCATGLSSRCYQVRSAGQRQCTAYNLHTTVHARRLACSCPSPYTLLRHCYGEGSIHTMPGVILLDSLHIRSTGGKYRTHSKEGRFLYKVGTLQEFRKRPFAQNNHYNFNIVVLYGSTLRYYRNCLLFLKGSPFFGLLS